jgi:hypothetical protein
VVALGRRGKDDRKPNTLDPLVLLFSRIFVIQTKPVPQSRVAIFANLFLLFNFALHINICFLFFYRFWRRNVSNQERGFTGVSTTPELRYRNTDNVHWEENLLSVYTESVDQ